MQLLFIVKNLSVVVVVVVVVMFDIDFRVFVIINDPDEHLCSLLIHTFLQTTALSLAFIEQAGAKSWGTDEDKFIEIFTKRSIPQLNAMYGEYTKVI